MKNLTAVGLFCTAFCTAFAQGAAPAPVISPPAVTGLVKQIEDFLGTIYDLPGYMLVGLSCIVFGYCLRFLKKFPNDGIPLACMLWGMIFNPLIADERPTDASLRVWLVRHILMGLIIGAGAWLTHKYLLSRFEASIPGFGSLLARADQRSGEVAVREAVSIVASSGTNVVSSSGTH